jgi:hypothetical protein
VTNWGNVKFTSSSVTLSSSSTTFAHGTTVTISGAVTPGAATGQVSLETTSTEPLQNAETAFTVGANGAYSATINYLPGGTYDIYGIYSGDGTYASSTSSKTSITVTPEASATTLYVLNASGKQVATSGSIPYGTQLLLDALPGSVVAANTSTGPTGTVTYLNGASTIGTATVNLGGEAELNYVPVPSATPYSITARYSGDASYNASTSAASTFTIVKDTPSLSIVTGTGASSPITAVSGDTSLSVGVQNTANLAAEQANGMYIVNYPVAPTGAVTVSGLPGGTLTFPALSAVVNPSSLFTAGVATLALPTETAGTYTLTISYPGDSNYNATSTTATITITAPTGIPTTTTATATPATSYATPAVVNFTVTGTTAGGPPTGTVTFITSGSSIGYINLPGGGTGSSVSETVSLNGYLATGTNELTVQYSGSSVYAPSVAIATTQNGGTTVPTGSIALSDSGPITLASGGATGTSTITVTPAGGFTGAVALGCVVTPASGASVPTCTVTTPVTIVGTSAATATLTVTSTSTTAAGTYTVTVTGTATGVASQTTTVAVTVQAATATPAIALSNSGSITLAGGGATGTSTITVTPSGGFIGSVALGCAVTGTGATAPTCSVATPVTIGGTTAGTATLTVTSTSSTTSGSYNVTVTGTGSGVASQTTTVAVTVQAVTQTPTVALSDSGSITIGTAGGSGTSTVTVTPGGGFSGSVSLACSVSSTVSEAPTCSVTSPGTLSGTTAGTGTLTVNTTAASAALELPRMRMLPIGGGIAAAALLFFLVPIKRRRISTLLGALVLIAVVGFSAGCGSGGTAPPSNPGTPAGTYSVTVSGTATGVTIAPITVTVTVQ